MNFRLLLFFAIVLFIGSGAVGRADTGASACAATSGPGLQVPGSGGAVADDARVSSGYRVRIGQHSTVFASDQNGSSGELIDFARNTDVLVMHLAIPENISGTGRKLHATLSVIAKIAAETGAGTPVLGHFMARGLVDGEENLKHIRSRYDGPALYADDLVYINF